MDGLLERDRELASLERLIAEARAGAGRVVLIEGPAGIGKTRLLAAARERAEGMTVLTARCSELEREFSFGAVRQLFEPVARDAERRARLLAGAATSADGVLGAPDGDAEGTFAVLHGLYWAALRGVNPLTASELRVAGLAADGSTNREIAQTLFVTPKTVEVHLSSAYRKLDIRSRRELAAALAS